MDPICFFPFYCLDGRATIIFWVVVGLGAILSGVIASRVFLRVTKDRVERGKEPKRHWVWLYSSVFVFAFVLALVLIASFLLLALWFLLFGLEDRPTFQLLLSLLIAAGLGGTQAWIQKWGES